MTRSKRGATRRCVQRGTVIEREKRSGDRTMYVEDLSNFMFHGDKSTLAALSAKFVAP